MIIDIEFKELEKLLKTKASLEQVIGALDMYGTPIDSVEGDVLRVEVSPNRMDMLCPEGVARALNGFLGAETGYPIWRTGPSGFDVQVDRSEIRPYLSFSAVLKSHISREAVKSLMQMQEKLHATVGRDRKKYSIGVYDLDKIKPPIMFKELPLKKINFTPLDESSDMNGKEILKSNEKGKAYAHLVGKNKAPALMDSEGQIISMPPIVNADFCKVTSQTKNFFIDSTGTVPGTDEIAAIVATAIVERGGSLGVTLPGPSYLPRRMKINNNYMSKMIGIDLDKDTLKDNLARMRIGFDDEALIPPYRLDLFGQIDLAEEVAIAQGYQNFEGAIPHSYSLGEPLEVRTLESEVRKLMTGFGFLELKTFMLTAPMLLNLAGPYELQVSNPKSNEYSALRQSMLPGIFEVLSLNKDADYPQRVFEVGTVFKPSEETRLAGLVVHNQASFAEIKAVVDRLVSALSVEIKWNPGDHQFFMSGRTAVSEIGVYGEVFPGISERVGMPVAGFEINLERIL
ncbi:phenylalanine--tRNA ligase subunit beta [Candidatus Bathyarchaeota archaeon]|nr:phenylalanine--tRNA ligase subunit beta [Candidatus Bathyarchaeota archaeon]